MIWPLRCWSQGNVSLFQAAVQERQADVGTLRVSVYLDFEAYGKTTLRLSQCVFALFLREQINKVVWYPFKSETYRDRYG